MMKKLSAKLLSVLIAVWMLLCTLPLTAAATEADEDTEIYEYTLTFMDGDVTSMSLTMLAVGYPEYTINIKLIGEYVFVGWSDEDGNVYAVGDTIVLTEETTVLYAVWDYTQYREYAYTLTYMDGDTIVAISKSDSAVFLISSSMSRSGCVFLGWSDEDGNLYNDGDIITLTEDTTLYATWYELPTYTYTLTYMSEDQVVSTYTMTSTEDAIEFTVNLELSSDHANFLGWSDADGTLYSIGDTIVLTEDTTLYASWDYWPTYTLTYMDGDEEIATTTQTSEYDAIEFMVSTMMSKYGYTFLGWSDSNGTLYSFGDTIILTEDTILYATWEEWPTYTLTYIVDGEVLDDYTTSVTTSDDSETIDITDYEPEKEGYTFTGWTDEDGNIYVYGDSITISGDVSLTAVFTKNADDPDISQSNRDTLKKRNDPLKQEMNISQQKTQELPALQSVTRKPAEKIPEFKLPELKSETKAPEVPKTYTVTYMVGNAAVSVETYFEGETATVQYYYGELTRAYTFAGWTVLDGDGNPTGETYREGDTFEVTGSVVLAAAWDEIVIEKSQKEDSPQGAEDAEKAVSENISIPDAAIQQDYTAEPIRSITTPDQK